MSRWFRHYAGMMRDDKLVRAAIKSSQPIERVVWIWGAILESAAEINDAGRYDFDTAEAAYFLRATEADLVAVVDALASTGRLADGAVVNWSARQFQSDRSAPRQAAYRERKRKLGRHGDVEKTESDGEVTSPSRHGDAPETETHTEKKETEAVASDAAPPPPVYTDSKHELWGEGTAILTSLGVPGKTARPIIGRWLRDAKDDAQSVLGAIQRARDNRVIDPIPWITRAIGAGNATDRQTGNTGKGRTFAAIALERARASGFDN